MTKLDGNKLLNARLDKGWSQEEAARHAGVNAVTYNKAENGGSVYPSTGKQIADALGLDLADVRIQILPSSDEDERSA